MKTFGFKKKQRKIKYEFILNISPIFFMMLVFSFSFFCMVNKISTVLGSVSQISILKDNIQDMAILSFPTDKEFSQVLFSIRNILETHEKNGNIFEKNQADIYLFVDYIQNKLDDLDRLEKLTERFFGIDNPIGLSQYKDFVDTLGESLLYKKDIFSLLGKDGPQSYMIVLQNTGEKRPNGGFFGSFALLTINGLKFDIEIIDSYKLLFLNPKAKVQTPQWASNIVPDKEFGFISSNKFGFTDLDGKNLKQIYEKVYPGKKLRGVVFVKSDYFEKIIPGFTEKLYEWQFVNASVDLIRGEDNINKKEFYLKEINQFVENQKYQIFKNILSDFQIVGKDNNMNLYLDEISDGFQNFIIKKGFTNIYTKNKIYFWDKNIGYNKIDRFVKKTIFLEDQNGNLLYEKQSDILEIDNLKPGKYIFKIIYDLNIPTTYLNTLDALEQKYNIELTDRENVILGARVYWDTEGMVYFPSNYKVLKVEGSPYSWKAFDTDFSSNVKYTINSKRNNVMRYSQITVQVE